MRIFGYSRETAILRPFAGREWHTVWLLGFTWGIGGVLFLLAFAIVRLAPMALDLNNFYLSGLQWAILILFVAYMAYAEGYKGFHKSFAPRVIVRANYLSQNPRILHVILAPLFCMGYFHATRKLMIMSIGLTVMIIVLVLGVRMLPQPWRGIIDAGVVVGLMMGISSIIYFLVQSRLRPELLTMSAEVPVSTPDTLQT
jgi:hypothetical protein